MHKNCPVIDIIMDEVTGHIENLATLHDPTHLPVGTTVSKVSLGSWWVGRSIPASRMGIREALESLGLSSTHMLLPRCFGLSLSDQYWVKPVGSNLTWSSINFFENQFSEDIGSVLFGKDVSVEDFDFRSPDNTTDGFLKKRWKIIDGKRCLLKAGTYPFQQQPLNEVIASMVAERLGIPHVPYSLLWDGDEPYSVCEDFVTADTELVSAWYVLQTKKKPNHVSLYQHYLDCCKTLGVPGIEQAVNQMIVLDYLIANEDRHLNNFGLVRDANTLEWVGAAPIFDSGSSLGYDKFAQQILSSRGVVCKPFKKTHEEQLKLVTSFDWLDLSGLMTIEQDVTDILDQAGYYLDDARKKAILSTFMQRVEHLLTL